MPQGPQLSKWRYRKHFLTSSNYQPIETASHFREGSDDPSYHDYRSQSSDDFGDLNQQEKIQMKLYNTKRNVFRSFFQGLWITEEIPEYKMKSILSR